MSEKKFSDLTLRRAKVEGWIVSDNFLTGVVAAFTTLKEATDFILREMGDAQPSATPDPDGWIPWAGGENPVPGKFVDFKVRDDSQIRMGWRSVEARWRHEQRHDDIIAYRIVKEA